MAALTSELDTQLITTKVKELLLANNLGQKVFNSIFSLAALIVRYDMSIDGRWMTLLIGVRSSPIDIIPFPNVSPVSIS
jgi:hypothetical protein